MKQLGRYAWPAYLALLFLVASATFVVEGFGHTFAKSNTVNCQRSGEQIHIQLTDTGFMPEHVEAKACDTLVFHNKTNNYVELAVGTHAHHIQYPGLTEGLVEAGSERELLLTEKGEYLVHDHLNDAHHVNLVVK